MEDAIHRARERVSEGRLANAGNILNEQVASGEQADEGKPDYFGFPSENQAQRSFQLFQFRDETGGSSNDWLWAILFHDTVGPHAVADSGVLPSPLAGG